MSRHTGEFEMTNAPRGAFVISGAVGQIPKMAIAPLTAAENDVVLLVVAQLGRGQSQRFAFLFRKFSDKQRAAVNLVR